MDEEQHQDGPLHEPDSGMTLPTLVLPTLVPGLQGSEASALQLRIKNSISKSVQSKVDTILQDVEKFTDIEKLYLYLKLPTGSSSNGDKSDQGLVSSSRTQQMHAFNWIRNHLEEHPETSLPKQEVYDEYKSYCDNLNYHPLSAADFGKMMKTVFPNMKARRLGMRGKSKYCYSGLRKRALVSTPSLPTLDLHKTGNAFEILDSPGHLSNIKEEVQFAACGLVCEWAQKVLSRQFDAVEDLARFLLNSHYISNKSMAALTILASTAPGVKSPQSTSAFIPTAEANSFQPQVTTLPSPSVDAKQQLQRKIHRKQQEQKLHSPLPGEGQVKRGESNTPAACAIPCASPTQHSPQPTIGIMVAAVPSPITVQRSRPLVSPSPAVAGENKMVPINFHVVAQPVQPVKLSPKPNQNILASPMVDRTARQRYPQILPKPSATSAITLHSPSTVLLANSSIKTVIPACHVSSVNVVKMTAISLAPNSITTTTNTVSHYGMAEETGVSPKKRSGSCAPILAPKANLGQANNPCNIDVEMEVEAIHESSQNVNANKFTLNQGTVAKRGALPRAASVPIPRSKGYLGPEDRSYARSNVTSSLGINTGAILEGGDDGTSSESILHSTVSTGNSPSFMRSNDGILFKEGLLSTTSPRKRTGFSPETPYSPLKRVYTSRQPEAGSDDFRDGITVMASKLPMTGVPLRSESAPAIGKELVKMISVSDSPQVLALSKSPFRRSGFQTVAKTQSTIERKNSCNVMETSNSLGHALIRQQYQMCNMKAISNSPDYQKDPFVHDLSSLSSMKVMSGAQEQRYGQMDIQADPMRTSTPVKEPLPAMIQAHPTTPKEMGYFLINDDDDVTQDSIVEELVQMEEQMKLNLQQFGPSLSFQRQQTAMQSNTMSTNQTLTPFYNSGNSSCTSIQTPTPTPTPTSEIIGGAKVLIRESPCFRIAPTTPVDSALGSSCHTPIGTPTSNCSSTVPTSLVECRNPFAFTPINSSITGYHDTNIVSSSPVKPMQRPMATHPDKAKLEWMNESYNRGSESNNGMGIIPRYQDLIEDHFQKPHAFAIPGQTFHSQVRHHGSHFGRLTPISPVQQQVACMANMTKREGFAVPAPLDNKATNIPATNATFRCRSVSPAVRQRNLSGNTGTNGTPNIAWKPVSPFNSPVPPEMLNILATNQQNMTVTSMAQRSQSVPVNVMMQTEVIPLQGQNKNLTNILLNKMDGDCDTAVRGLGINNLPSNYTACMNLTQLLEPNLTSANQQTSMSSTDNSSKYQFQKRNYLTQNTINEQMILSPGGGQAQSAVSSQYQQQCQTMRLPQNQREQQQQQQEQLLDFDTTVKTFLTDNSSLTSGNMLSEQVSELNTGGVEFPGEIGMTSELSSSINDLNTLDTNLLFDPNQQQGPYQDTTPEDIMNDPLFQQICSETANTAGFDWLESKDHPTVGLMG